MGKRVLGPDYKAVNPASDIKLRENGASIESIFDEYEHLTELDKALHGTLSKKIGWQYTVERHLNRYPTILPYDYNRVKLINLIEECDYVNASWITGPLEIDENIENTKMKELLRKLISFGL